MIGEGPKRNDGYTESDHTEDDEEPSPPGYAMCTAQRGKRGRTDEPSYGSSNDIGT